MARWARDVQPAADLRDRMIAHYEEMIAGRPWARERIYGPLIERLREGGPIVLAGWQLARYGLPEVRRGKHAYYRVEPDGRVVEVVERRDPADPMSFLGWD